LFAENFPSVFNVILMQLKKPKELVSLKTTGSPFGTVTDDPSFPLLCFAQWDGNLRTKREMFAKETPSANGAVETRGGAPPLQKGITESISFSYKILCAFTLSRFQEFLPQTISGDIPSSVDGKRKIAFVIF
jgi:hypothetical protein